MPFHHRRGWGWRLILAWKREWPALLPLGLSAQGHKQCCEFRRWLSWASWLMPGKSHPCSVPKYLPLYARLFPAFKKGSESFWWQLSYPLRLVSWFMACIILYQHTRPELELYNCVATYELMCVYTNLSGRPWDLAVWPCTTVAAFGHLHLLIWLWACQWLATYRCCRGGWAVCWEDTI